MTSKIVVMDAAELRALIDEAVSQAIAGQPAPEQPDTLPDWLTRRQAAEYLGCSLGSIDNYARAGILRKQYLGSLPRFAKEDVRRAVEAITNAKTA